MGVEVALLGGFAVSVDGSAVAHSAWKSRRAAQLVALLALVPTRRLATEQVMDALWPDLSPEAGRANLHKTATLARHAMGSKESIVLRGDAVSLWPSVRVETDLDEFETAARRALMSQDPGQCTEVARRFQGELLPNERYEEWAMAARQRVERLHLDVLRAGGLGPSWPKQIRPTRARSGD